jgi:D-psicose/D-tagatose/L-ribulose 3-epimerase
MKFGVNTFIWTANFTVDNLPLLPPIKRHGFDGIEVPLFDPNNFAAEDIRTGVEGNGLECTVCSVISHGMSLIADDADVRRRTIAHLKECAKATAEAGSAILAGPLYAPIGEMPGRRRTSAEWQRAVEGYQAIAPTFAAHGVTLALEPLNRFETYFLNTAADAAELCKQVDHPNVGILFDTFHANIEEKNIADGFRTVAQYLKHVHTCENDRGTPGSGHVEWKPVFQALAEIGYDGWLTIESFGSAVPEISAAASIWRDIEPVTDSIAFDGIKFLKKSVAEL